MPNRYEREIEEILRNLEHSDPKQGLGQKLGARFRRRPDTRGGHRPQIFSYNFSIAERLLLIAVVTALIAGGYAYTVGPNVITFMLALIGVICLILVALSQFLFQPRRVPSARYGNITITPLRRSPLQMIKTQWNLFKLKMKYRRKSEH
jgi:ABC-type multidrug transport system fused ATPase/permease subunit